MSIQKTATFLADCLKHMPDQPKQVQRVVNIAVAGLKRIADGGEWPEYEVMATLAACAAARGDDAADWAAAWAVYAAARAADAAACAAYGAEQAAHWAAKAHPDPAKERARQAKVRKELGI